MQQSEEMKRAWEREQCIALNFNPADDHRETLLREDTFHTPLEFVQDVNFSAENDRQQSR